ncbi:hypothetical protein CNMCM8980_003594 [Aspergillus fumigatiaffinis]|nr:hypothetical protein CNMCM8980_003594 [Aspergillus fumigatiaffinis]
MEVALLEDEMVSFAGYVQRLFDAQGYLGASTLGKYTCLCPLFLPSSSPFVPGADAPPPPLVTSEEGRLVNPSGTCWLLKAGWLLYTGFSPGIARVLAHSLESTAVVGKGPAVECQDSWANLEPYMAPPWDSLRTVIADAMGQTIETTANSQPNGTSPFVYTDGSGLEWNIGAAAVVPSSRVARRYLGQGARVVVSGASQWRWRLLPLGGPLHSQGDDLVDELTPRQRGIILQSAGARDKGGEITYKAAKEAKMPSAGPEQTLATTLKRKERREAQLAWERQ